MRIYAIYNIPHQTFVRWGVNGGGKESYCIFRGKPCFFKTKREAQKVIQEYGIPEHYEVRCFKEMEVA